VDDPTATLHDAQGQKKEALECMAKVRVPVMQIHANRQMMSFIARIVCENPV
jgi:hypothetical protein